MNHEFQPSPINSDFCKICRRQKAYHDSCDSCKYIGPDLESKFIRGQNSWLCPECRLDYEKKSNVTTVVRGVCPICNQEWASHSEHQLESCRNPLAIRDSQKPIDAREVIKESKQIDSTIHFSHDIFNAKTVAIIELEKVIQADDTIANKPFVLATTLDERFKLLRSKAIEIQSQLSEIGTEMRAIQQYMNTLANKITKEEREKISLSDIDYKPKEHKTTVTKTAVKKPVKFEKSLIREAAKKYNLPELAIRLAVVKNNCTPDEAGKLLKESMDALVAKTKQ